MFASLLAASPTLLGAAPAPANVYVEATVSGGVPSPASALSATDCALLIQMTGTIADGLGVYEILDPATATPTRTYADGEFVQYVVLPGGCDQAIEVDATYSPPPWNPATGTGGVVFLGGTTLSLNADIDASGAGFATGHSVGAGCDGGDGEHYNATMWEGGGGGGGIIGGGGGASGHIGDTDFGTEATFDGSPGGGGTATAPGAGGQNGDSYGVSPDGGAAGCVGNGGSAEQTTVAGGFWTTGAGAGGGGSYGAGGGACSSLNSGAYAGGGGGGGSFTGGGAGGIGGTNTGWVLPEENGAPGNVASTTAITTGQHFFHDGDARVMMGGAGGGSFLGDGSGPYDGGRGGGIVVLDFDTVAGGGGAIVSDGGAGSTPPNFSGEGSHGSSGSGGGAGGQIVIFSPSVSSIEVSAAGGVGGRAVEDTSSTGFPHTGSAGATGGGGGIWFAHVGVDSSNSGPNAAATSLDVPLAAPGLTGVEWAVNAGHPALDEYPNSVTVGSTTYTGAEWAAIVGAANLDSQTTFKWISQSLVDASAGGFDLNELITRFPALEQPNNPKNLGLGCTPGMGGTGLVVTSTPPLPAIEIETSTNGVDADTAPGVELVIGQSVTWDYEVTATESGSVENIVVVDDIVGAVTCPLTTLAAGESMTCSADGVVADGPYVNVATVTGDGLDDGGTPTGVVTDTDPTNHLGVAPTISIETTTNGVQADGGAAENPVAIGDPVTWAFDVENGPIPVVDVAVTNAVDVANDQPGADAIVCDWANSSDPATGADELSPGETVSCVSDVGVAGTGDHENTATVDAVAAEVDVVSGSLVAIVDATTGDPIPVTDTDPSGYVGEPSYDLALAVVSAGTAITPTATEATFTVTVANQGEIDSGPITVTAELPEGTEFVSASATGAEASPGIVAWDLAAAASIAPAATLDLEVVVAITDPNLSPYTLTAEVSADNGDDTDSTPDAVLTGAGADNLVDITDPAELANDTGTNVPDEDDHDIAAVTLDYDLSLTNDVIDVAAGQVTYETTVTNEGDLFSGAFDVSATIPPGTTFASATDAATSTATTVEWTIPATAELAPGDSTSMSFTVDVVDASQTPFPSTSEISADSGPDVDSTPANGAVEDDRSSAAVDVYDLALTETLGTVASPLLSTGEVTFDITITNQGGPVETIEVVDYIDPALFEAMTIDALTNAPGTAGGTAANAFTYTWSGAGSLSPTVTITAATAGETLAYGETVVVPITLTVAGDWDGSDLENWSEIARFDSDADPANGDSAAAGSGVQLVDLDSTPDVDQFDDAAPATFGSPTDDAIANESGDEDDHDVAGVAIHDVSLIVDLAPGQPDQVDMTVAEPQASFVIEVKNQGNHPVSDVAIAGHTPAGLSISNPDTNSANSALPGLQRTGDDFTVRGPIAPGETVVMTVVFDVVDANVGPFLFEAEIAAADDADGMPIADIDSVVDATVGNDVVVNVASAGDDVVVNSHDDVDYDRTAANAPIVTPEDDDDHGQELIGVGADLSLALAADLAQPSLADGVQVGDLVTVEAIVTNEGAPVGAVDVVLYLPEGLTYSTANNTLDTVTDDGDADVLSTTWGTTAPSVSVSGDALDSGESVTVPVVVSVDAGWTGDSLVVGAEIARFDDDTDPATGDSTQAGTGVLVVDVDSTPDAIDGNDDPAEDDRADVSVPVWDLRVDAELAADQPAAVDLTQDPATITYDVSVTNEGGETAYNVLVENTLPDGTTFDSSAVPDVVFDSPDEVFVVPSLAPGATTTMTLVVAVDTANLQEVYEHTATLVGFDDDTNPGNALPAHVVDSDVEPPVTTTAVLPHDLAISATIDPLATEYPVAPASPVTVMIELENRGFAVESIDVAAVLDATLWAGFDPALNADGVTAGDQALPFTWDATDAESPVLRIVGPLALGERVAIPLTVVVADDLVAADGPLEIAVEIAAFDDDLDPANAAPIDVTPQDDVDAVTIDLLDLALRLVLDPATALPVQPGQDVSFLAEVINQGTVTAADVEVVAYVDLSMWTPFDVADNPAGDAPDVVHSWAAAGTDGVVTVPGPIDPGASVVVPLTLTITDGADLTTLLATAEIAAATATDGGVAAVNADGSAMVDFDSVPDAVNDDPVVDDAVEATEGDEDDHDVAAVEAPLYSLGNQVWNDADDDGVIDADEAPIAGVVVELFTDADGDGLADDLDADGAITSADAVATATTDADGGYLFTDLETGDYVVGVAGSNWDAGAALENAMLSSVVASDANDDVDDDANGIGCDCPEGYVLSASVELVGAEPIEEPGLANDAATFDANSNLSVDFGFRFPVFDMTITLTPQVDGPVVSGDLVELEVAFVNDGDVHVAGGEVVVPLPDGVDLEDPALPIDDEGNARIVLDEPLAPEETFSVVLGKRITATGPVTLTAHVDDSAVTPTDADGNVLLLPNGEPLAEADSLGDQPGDPGGSVTIEVLESAEDASTQQNVTSDPQNVGSTPPPPALAFTGTDTGRAVMVATLLIVLGLALVFRRRRLVIES